LWSLAGDWGRDGVLEDGLDGVVLRDDVRLRDGERARLASELKIGSWCEWLRGNPRPCIDSLSILRDGERDRTTSEAKYGSTYELLRTCTSLDCLSDLRELLRGRFLALCTSRGVCEKGSSETGSSVGYV
jgi:hypothetical protein